ncbi:molybdopterin-dependent oxidoreductase [Streptomyces sp. NPDC054765]
MGSDDPGMGGGPYATDGLLPPGQRLARGWPVSHYGPVPRFRPDRWDLKVFGATASGDNRTWTLDEFTALPAIEVVADLHCASGPTTIGHEWFGVAATTLLELAPPSPHATHVMAWAEYGYSANIRLSDFASPQTLVATHHNGESLTAEHGFPLRLVVPHLYSYKGPKWLRGLEYMTADRRGFWEERGYHNIGEAWRGQRHSYQEEEGDGPPL